MIQDWPWFNISSSWTMVGLGIRWTSISSMLEFSKK